MTGIRIALRKGGEFYTSVNALTGDVHDSYDSPDDDATTKHPVRRVCKLPRRMAQSTNRTGHSDTRQMLALRCEAWEATMKRGLPRSVSTRV